MPTRTQTPTPLPPRATRPTRAKPARPAKPRPTGKQRDIAERRQQAKAASRSPPRPRQHAVPAPGIAGPDVANRAVPNPEAHADYLTMARILMEVLPEDKPGLPTGEVYDAVRAAAPRKQFPGDTSRMWAKQVLLDLEAQGILVRSTRGSERWRHR